MGINEIIMYIMMFFMLIAAVDRILSQFGGSARFLGKFGKSIEGSGGQFEEGFMAMGALGLAMVGMTALAPVLAHVLGPVIIPVYEMLGANPSMFAGTLLACDMGGPVNKVAYAFMLICVAQGVYTVVAIAAVGICVPPLGMGLATLIGRKNFSAEERETGKAALVMGCVGVTEGAIPFAAADPLRVIPSIMVGSVCGAVTAALVGAQCYAGWGGLIVLPVVEGKLGYIAAVAVGAVVTAVCVNVLKSLARKNGSSTDEKEDDLDLDFEIN